MLSGVFIKVANAVAWKTHCPRVRSTVSGVHVSDLVYIRSLFIIVDETVCKASRLIGFASQEDLAKENDNGINFAGALLRI